ncbi:hypothetical protein SBRY_50598 [Actinacidiphila bryophytorum]|uniref:Uncharacterized protein n=1 Tax=Actinacidiphila bryophytorum TaxID=1436133 RepID=A0A9W4H552_9ACTN|nr:hypothetical protein SBRY_50598 [Actinacidiphila bryophytorum]
MQAAARGSVPIRARARRSVGHWPNGVRGGNSLLRGTRATPRATGAWCGARLRRKGAHAPRGWRAAPLAPPPRGPQEGVRGSGSRGSPGTVAQSTPQVGAVLVGCGHEPRDPETARGTGRYPHLQTGPAAGRRGGCAGLQAVLEREPVPAAARCSGGGHRRRGVLQSLSGLVLLAPHRRAGGAFRGAGRACGDRHGLGGCGAAAAAGDLGSRRRSDLRLAVLRGLSDHHQDQRGAAGAGAAGRRRAARPGRDGRRGHRTDPADLRLQPQQPHRHRGAQGRAGALPRPGPRRRPGGAGRGLPGVHHRPRRARRHRGLPGPAQRGGAAHLLQGVRPCGPASRLRHRARAGGGGAAQDRGALRGEPARAGRRGGEPAGRAGAAGAGRGPGRRAGTGGRRADRAGLDGAGDPGQLRLAAAGGAHGGIRRGVRAGRHHGPALRGRGCADHGGGDGGERPAAADRRGLPQGALTASPALTGAWNAALTCWFAP